MMNQFHSALPSRRSTSRMRNSNTTNHVNKARCNTAISQTVVFTPGACIQSHSLIQCTDGAGYVTQYRSHSQLVDIIGVVSTLAERLCRSTSHRQQTTSSNDGMNIKKTEVIRQNYPHSYVIIRKLSTE